MNQGTDLHLQKQEFKLLQNVHVHPIGGMLVIFAKY